MSSTGARQLQRELNLRLMLPVMGIVVLTSVFGLYGARSHVDRVFDRWLLDAARSLAEQVRFVDGQAEVELSAQGEALLTYDIVDDTYFEVVQGTRHLVGQPAIPRNGERSTSYGGEGRAYDTRFLGHEVRVAEVVVPDPAGPPVTVLVAETLIKRQRARDDLILTMAPAVVLVLFTAIIVGWGVRRTIRTLERFASRWNDRSHASLDALSLDDVPKELIPFASALNDLLARVRAMLARERQFAATVAHQLRTPLTGLALGMARAAEAPDAEAMRSVIHDLGETTQRTSRLIQQLLALSRLDPEVRAGLPFVDVDLVGLAREVGETYHGAALDKGIELELISSVDRMIVSGEPELLSEALGNLIDNAIRHTPAGSRILIGLGADPARLCVSDSGPGIDPAEQDAIFERFVRGKAAVGEGSGLGLAIVKAIADLHGATVVLSRSALGGAELTIVFG